MLANKLRFTRILIGALKRRILVFAVGVEPTTAFRGSLSQSGVFTNFTTGTRLLIGRRRRILVVPVGFEPTHKHFLRVPPTASWVTGPSLVGIEGVEPSLNGSKPFVSP